MHAFVLDPTYVTDTSSDQAIVHLWCRLDDGRSALIKKPFKPYFFIKQSDQKAAQRNTGAIPVTFSKTELKTVQEDAVVQVTTNIPADVPKLKDAFENQEVKCYEADIRFAYRAMMDWGVHGSFSLKGEAKEAEGLGVDVIFDDPEIGPPTKQYVPKLSLFSFDIESDKETEALFCLSCYGQDQHEQIFQEKFIIAEQKVNGAQTFKTEKELLEAFVAYVNKVNPDVITGWNVIDFDLAFLQERMKKAKVDFRIGRDNAKLRMRLESSFFRDSSAHVTGRLVLDGIQLLKNNFIRLQDYKLDTAAKKYADEGKLIQSTGKEKYLEIRELYETNKQKLLDYNLLDAKLAFDVIMNSGAFPLTIKRSLLVAMPLDRVSASIASLDSLYLRELRKRGYVAPITGNNPRDEGMGGFVMQSKPGIYDYVIVCDFKSLYPSIMRTFNIDPLMYVPDVKKSKKYIFAPNGAAFKRELGIVPGLISNFWAEREKARKAKDELARYAIKIHMNSMYGVLASTNYRFFNRHIGNAITSFAQFFIKLAAEHIEEQGFEVIYGDTDSTFINLDVADYDAAQKIGKKIEKSTNTFLKEYVEKEYGVDSFLELEFEKTFIRFIMPKVRGSSDKGAKKRYAGLIRKEDGSEDMSFTGLEMVRRDWTDLAKDFQYNLYMKVFKREEIAEYVKNFIKELLAGTYDEKLIYRKALRKDVAEYTKTTPPHVKAALKLGKVESDLIEYVMTKDGPEPVQKIEHEIDYDHYIDKQLKPIADSLLGFYGTSFDEQVSGQSQASLFDF